MTAIEGERLDPFAVFSPYRFEREDCVIVALSGGGDSTALLLLCKAYLDRSAPGVRLLAVTVDHGLRPESADEARQVAALCAARGIGHLTLRWDGEKPARGKSAAAREARYRLLAAAARKNDARIMLIGHTLDDQIETVAMRETRGEGRGLAGIAPATLYAGKIWIARPLLGCRREALRNHLVRQGVSWIEDPSNLDPAYERPRVRAGLGRAQAGEAGRLARLAAEMAGARLELSAASARLIRMQVRLAAPGLVFIERDFARGSDPKIAAYMLRLLLATVGGREQLPDTGRVAALLDRIREPARLTLSRVAVDIRRDGLYLRRELRGLPEIAAAEGALWDARFLVEGGADATVAAIGRANAAEIFDETEGVPKALAISALAAEPGLWREGGFLGPLFAEAGTTAALRQITPFARFLPSFDLAPAGALAEVFGLPPLPEPPWQSHIDAVA